MTNEKIGIASHKTYYPYNYLDKIEYTIPAIATAAPLTTAEIAAIFI